jgi:uncharacterized protein involved in exopolysaccharide biosynthesis
MNNKSQIGNHFSSTDLLLYIWQKRVILLVITLLAALSSIIISLQIKEKYRSTVVLFPTSGAAVSKTLLSDNYMGTENFYGFGEEEQTEQLLQVLNSELIRATIIQKYDLMKHYEIDPSSRYPYTQLANLYKKNISFRRTDLMSVEISVLDRDPRLAAEIANDIAGLVDTVFNAMKLERARAAFELVQTEYLEAEKYIRQLQDSLGRVNLHSGHGGDFLVLTNYLDHETERLAKLHQRYQEARAELNQRLPYKFVVDNAYPSEKKDYPRRSIIVAISTASSFLFTLILLIVFDSVKQRVIVTKED